MTAPPAGIATVLDRGLTHTPDAAAVQGRSGTLSYRDLDAAVDAAAGGLWELGVRTGDRIAACLPNDIDIVVAFHAAMRLGALWVGLGTALAAPEQIRLLRDCSPVVLVTTPDIHDELCAQPGWPTCRPHVVLTDRSENGWAALTQAGHRARAIRVDPHAPAGIAYTSGTTGTPKGIVHSQHNLLLPGAVLVFERAYGPELRKGDCLPLTILNLMVLTTLLTAQAGGCAVVMDRRDAPGIATWVRDHRVTVWNGVPTQLRDLALDESVTRSDFNSLREVWCGGAQCPADVRTAFADKFGLPISATYGLTEAPTIVAIGPASGEGRPQTCGRVLPHLAIDIFDESGTATVDIGEICVRASEDGPWARQWTPSLGHWEGGAVVSQPPGPLRTGDLGEIDDGWLRVVDRKKLVILRGGANVYPAEVERVLLECNGVAEAAVFGVPDERLGERVAAVVVPTLGHRPSARTLTEHCSVRLARYKRPEIIGFSNALPRNAMGKIIRPELPRLLGAHPNHQATNA